MTFINTMLVLFVLIGVIVAYISPYSKVGVLTTVILIGVVVWYVTVFILMQVADTHIVVENTENPDVVRIVEKFDNEFLVEHFFWVDWLDEEFQYVGE